MSFVYFSMTWITIVISYLILLKLSWEFSVRKNINLLDNKIMRFFNWNYSGYNIFNPLWLSTKIKKIYAAYFTLIVPFVSYILISSVYNVRDDIELEFSALGGMFANIQVDFSLYLLSKLYVYNHIHFSDISENCHPYKVQEATSWSEKFCD